jgi:2-keto-4-pentenoate hydratase/2-oxohepta-3-ene-1,7-dioic acid hydratase in catechol pathway
MWLTVNGQSRQKALNMIFDAVLWPTSEFMTLPPGDVVSTGTPRRGPAWERLPRGGTEPKSLARR